MTANGVAAAPASSFDRHEFRAERRHHRLPGEARPHSRLHRSYGLCLLLITRSATSRFSQAHDASFRNAVTAETNEVEGFGQDLARDAGARPFALSDEVKPLYHAGAVFASNYLVAVEALAEQILTAAGVAGADLIAAALVTTRTTPGVEVSPPDPPI